MGTDHRENVGGTASKKVGRRRTVEELRNLSHQLSPPELTSTTSPSSPPSPPPLLPPTTARPSSASSRSNPSTRLLSPTSLPPPPRSSTAPAPSPPWRMRRRCVAHGEGAVRSVRDGSGGDLRCKGLFNNIK